MGLLVVMRINIKYEKQLLTGDKNAEQWELIFFIAAAVDPAVMKNAADSLLPIVQSQRERFRQRAQELETVCDLAFIFK